MTDINKLLRVSPVNSRYGAPMGRYDRIGPESGLYCQRVYFQDGDYPADGTYWDSGGGPLYAAFSPDLETLCFVRAGSRATAVAEFDKRGLTFRKAK